MDTESPTDSVLSVIHAVYDAWAAGDAEAFADEDIFPDPLSATLAESWRSGAVKAMERDNAAFVQAPPSAA